MRCLGVEYDWRALSATHSPLVNRRRSVDNYHAGLLHSVGKLSQPGGPLTGLSTVTMGLSPFRESCRSSTRKGSSSGRSGSAAALWSTITLWQKQESRQLALPIFRSTPGGPSGNCPNSDLLDKEEGIFDHGRIRLMVLRCFGCVAYLHKKCYIITGLTLPKGRARKYLTYYRLRRYR